MSETSALLERIDAEFRGVDAKLKQFQAEKVQEFEGRQQRLEQFVALCDKLREVWGPRLEAFAAKFKDRIQATPVIKKSRRSVTYRFASPLAQFDMTLSAMTDADVRHLVLDYTLDVLPILMNFEKHCQLEVPLDDVDSAMIEKWIDDRLVETVRTYLELHQNANYLKGHLVRDPVANVEFPKYAAGATLEWKGRTYYFVGEESRDEFARENQIAV